MHEQDLSGEQKMELLVPIRTAGLGVEAREMFDSIAKRAYEIFESTGRLSGRELENWLQAEAELVTPMPIDVKESPEGVTVLAEVGGFTPKELEVDLEPKRVIIVGKRNSQTKRRPGRGVFPRRHTTRLLRTLQLPVEIDTSNATARLKRGILEIDAKKAPAGKSKTTQLVSDASPS